MADDAGDAGKAPSQPPLGGVNQVMHRADRQGRVDAAMKIDNFAIAGFAHADVVHFSEPGDVRGKLARARRQFLQPARLPRRARRARRPAGARCGFPLRRPGPSSSRIASSSRLAVSCAALSGNVPSTSRSNDTESRSASACTATWCTARLRLRAINMTRSRTVSSSSARGSVVIVISASGSPARTAASTDP